MASDQSCRHNGDMILDYLDGTLCDSDRRLFEEHIAACESCRTDLERYRAVVEAISSAVYTPPDTLPDTVMKRIKTDSKHSLRRRIIRYGSVAVAAMLVLTVALGTPLIKMLTGSDAAKDGITENSMETTASAATSEETEMPDRAMSAYDGDKNGDNNTVDETEEAAEDNDAPLAVSGFSFKSSFETQSEEEAIEYYLDSYLPDYGGTVGELDIAQYGGDAHNLEIYGVLLAEGDDWSAYELYEPPADYTYITETYFGEDENGSIILIAFD